MPSKQTNSVKYLINCRNLEYATYSLYSTAVKKVNRTEISVILRAIGQDCFKHTKVIEELFKPLSLTSYESGKDDKNFNKISAEIRNYTTKLSLIDTVNDDELPDFLNDLSEIEDFMSDFYSYFINSQMLKQLANQLSTSTQITSENLLFILQSMKDDNQKHRKMLSESLYFFNKNKINRNTAPIVRFQNPDAWLHS
jgi:hypothetical protein